MAVPGVYSMYLKKLCFIVLLLFSSDAFAYEIYLGVDVGLKTLTVRDSKNDNTNLGTMKSKFTVSPSVGYQTSEYYFSDTSKWGYYFEVNGATYTTDKQQVIDPDGVHILDLDTEIKGFSLYALPVIYYHFNRFSDNRKISYKLGAGAGIGYLDLNGTIKVTNLSHPEFDEYKTVNSANYGYTMGFYFEIAYKNFSYSVQGYGPSTSDSIYSYQFSNFVASFRYAFQL